MPRLFMAIRTGGALPDRGNHGPNAAIPDNCQWAMFLRNHDELTLEMVTDEERITCIASMPRRPGADQSGHPAPAGAADATTIAGESN